MKNARHQPSGMFFTRTSLYRKTSSVLCDGYSQRKQIAILNYPTIYLIVYTSSLISIGFKKLPCKKGFSMLTSNEWIIVIFKQDFPLQIDLQWCVMYKCCCIKILCNTMLSSLLKYLRRQRCCYCVHSTFTN